MCGVLLGDGDVAVVGVVDAAAVRRCPFFPPPFLAVTALPKFCLKFYYRYNAKFY
eukprot:SAG11_NODE_2470_length_3319_cov_30.880435_2_plen_55_part_00